MKRIKSLDLLKSKQSNNRVLFLEGESDFDVLRSWAQVLGHRLYKWLDQEAYWYDMQGKLPKTATEHFHALRAVCSEMKGFVLLDSDNAQSPPEFPPDPDIIMRQWQRYETESYLVHPDAIKRFLEPGLFGPYPDKAEKKLQGSMPREYFEDPLNDPSDYLKSAKGSDILAKVFSAAKSRISKGEYYRLAAVMKPEEVHDDVRNMLDAIADHFGINE